MSTITPKSKALVLLRGKKLLLPDLYDTLPGWRFDLSTDCSPRVHAAIDSWEQCFTTTNGIHEKSRVGNFGLLAKCFYPDAGEEEIAVMGCYLAWIFEWDDRFDIKPEPFDMQQVQDETKRNLAYLLTNQPAQKPADLSPINASFSGIAAKIVAKCSAESCKRLLRDLEEYVDGVVGRNEVEDGCVPTVAEHYATRRLAVGVRPTTELIEYCYGLDIPSRIMQHDSIQEILQRTTEIVMIANDIVSLSRELAADHVDNIVCVLAYHDGISAQEAMDQATRFIREAHTAFEAAERRLPVPTGDPKVDEDVRKFVLGCKDVCTGNISWSYNTGRYFGKNLIREEGRVVINL